jgi:hypothetical protein
MSGDPDREGRDDGAEAPPAADDEYARGYAEGYGEGLRAALREVLEHASRGHTAHELRILIESRLARIDEEVELKRRSLVRPPRRPAWPALLRPPAPPSAWSPIREALPAAPVAPASRTLVREERPKRALGILEASRPRFARLVLVSTQPPALEPGPALQWLRPGRPTAAEGEGGLAPGEISGRLVEATEAGGSALVYLDAIEFLVTSYGFETVYKFLDWFAGWTAETGSALVAVVDPRALDAKELGRLQRLFSNIA